MLYALDIKAPLFMYPVDKSDHAIPKLWQRSQKGDSLESSSEDDAMTEHSI